MSLFRLSAGEALFHFVQRFGHDAELEGGLRPAVLDDVLVAKDAVRNVEVDEAR